jgi:hypothetical protein
VFVAVNDHKTSEAFSLKVPEGERAIWVSRHPHVSAAA